MGLINIQNGVTAKYNILKASVVNYGAFLKSGLWVYQAAGT